MRSLSQTLEGMCLGFDPSAASGLVAEIQFEVSGDEPGTYHLRIDHGKCTFHPARAESPTLVIRTPSEVWLRISQGELSGRDALLQGLYEVEGDPGLLMRMDSLFPRSDEVSIEATGDQRPAGPLPVAGNRWLAIDFLPWIVLWAGFGSQGRGDWPALAVSLALSAAVVTYRRTYNRPTAFEVANLGFFAITLVAWLGLSAWLAAWGSTVGTIALGAIWLGTVLPGGTPLTSAYSKWRYVPALWSNSTFLHVNAVLTLMWGWVFVLQGSTDVWAAADSRLVPPLTAFKFGLLVPASLATVQYPRRGAEIGLADPRRRGRRLQLLAVLGLVTAFGLTVATGAATVAGIIR
jgi:putative sterol carrier protein